MKLPIALIMAVAVAAGPAVAQGTFNNGSKPSTGFGTPSSAAKPPGAYLPNPAPAPAARPRNPGMAEAPDAPVFKPYQPYKPASTYGTPKPPAYGAKPCETSVYVNSCGR